jgi:hypothetical protein
MMRLRLMLSVIALVAGGALLWEAESLKAEVEAFADRETVVTPDQLPARFPRVTRIFEKRGLYPEWPDELSPVEVKNLVSQLLHDAKLRHGQFVATGWSLLFVGGFGLWLHYRCPLCRIQTRKEIPSC